jgi:hypothetical protein
MVKPSSSPAFLAALVFFFPAALTAQFPVVDFTGSVSAGVGSPVRCESCEDLAVARTLGVLIKDRFGIGYRGVRWGDQKRSSMSRMSTDLLTADVHWPTPGRIRPFFSGGLGRTSARIRAGDGGHAYYDYGPASSLPTMFWGVGVDMRVFRRVALTPMISSTSTTGGDSQATHCTQYNYMSGDFSYTCGSLSSHKYALTGFSIGIGIR